MLDIYLYSLDRMPKEAMIDIFALKVGISWQSGSSPESITMHSSGSSGRQELRFDVSVLDYETKHEIDLRIRKILKKHRIKFVFSNASNPKLNFYYGQKVITS
jgi:hypothetical protein